MLPSNANPAYDNLIDPRYSPTDAEAGQEGVHRSPVGEQVSQAIQSSANRTIDKSKKKKDKA
jgi:hypothetical protein